VREGPKETKKMILYNLFPLLAGPFSSWGEHFARASDMGFNWVFVNPIQLPGRSGSLYSIADYFRFNPRLVDAECGSPAEEQVRDAVAAAQERGLRMMIDLVINHCSVDAELLKKHPEWFVWEKNGKVAHPGCNENGRKVVWKDLARFDHRHSRDPEGMFRFFRRVVDHLLDLGFRGFRCDAAYQTPASLWSRLIRETKSRCPEALFAAETLGCTIEQTRKTASAGFDYIFNSSKWWDFNGHWLMEQYNLTRELAPSIGFPESHDTLRLCDELHGNVDGLKQRYLFASLFSAGVLMPMGFEYGARKKPHVVKTRPGDWEEPYVDLSGFIRKVNTLKAQHPIFQEEAPTEILSTANPSVLVMWKGSVRSQEESLLILNKDIRNRQTFSTPRIRDLVQAGAPLVDISPEDPLEYIPEPFSYDLGPGQGIVLITTRDVIPED
jgi:starch synthase (maltosyl-transferring)